MRLLLLAVLLAGCGGGAAATASSTGSVAGAAAARRPAIPSFTHVLVVVFENREAIDVDGSSGAPTFHALARRYATLTSYTGVAHPSLPNYLALVSGSTQGISSDCDSCLVSARNLADTLAAAGKTWKTYAEGLPSPGFTGAYAGRYAKKHVPFLYFRDVLRSPKRRRDVVPFSRLAHDVKARRLPSYALVIPDVCDDMHDCSIATGDDWLRREIVPLLRSPALAGGVVFVVFDEGTTNEGGGGEVEALALGPTVRPDSVFAKPTNHYGLLRTVEQAWGLPLLGKSRNATPITGIWR